MAWTPFKNSKSREIKPGVEPSTQRDAENILRITGNGGGRLSLDAIGQRDELVRQRISGMIDRIEDLRTLQDDFRLVLEPLVRISEELPKATARNAELEVALTQERQSLGTTRTELASLGARLHSASDSLSTMTSRVDKAETDLADTQATVEELRVSLRDKTLALENLERQLFAETEQNKALAGENKALRLEAQATDAALSRSEHELQTVRERLSVLEQDNARLQNLSEGQSLQLAELATRHKELDASAEAARIRHHQVEAQLAAEFAKRERAEQQYEAEIGGYRTENASLFMKLEAVTGRAASTEQLLGQVRGHLREKDEAHRTAERSWKEASIARTTAERRIEGLQADLARQTERFIELQRHRTELDARCDMLAKALAAKDAVIEQAGSRNGVLVDRIEQLTRNHEGARAELEATARRLTEELESERSERTLVQGALDIARESRTVLQKQHDALRRSARGWREAAGGEAARADGDIEDGRSVDIASNVHAFSPAKPN